MAEYFLEGVTAAGERIYLSPLSEMRIRSAGQNADNVSGHFLYTKSQTSNSELTILAHVTGNDEVFKLGRLLGLA